MVFRMGGSLPNFPDSVWEISEAGYARKNRRMFSRLFTPKPRPN